MPPPTIDQFKRGLAEARQHDTVQSLGDRTGYIGASDIARCPRQTILSKTSPKPPDLKSLICFERGHLAEEIAARAFNGSRPERQLELSTSVPYCPACGWTPDLTGNEYQTCPACGEVSDIMPVKAHCDLAFSDDLILEVKSSDLMEIQDAWIMQLKMQLLLYRHCLNRDPTGMVMVIDLARGRLAFSEIYTPDPGVLPGLLKRGIDIWQGIEAATLATDPENAGFKTEPSPLCGCCDYLDTCPAFAGEELPEEMEEFFSRYLDAANAEKEAKARREILRDQALAILAPGKYTAGNLRVSLSKRSRTRTDTKALAFLLAELGQDIAHYQKSHPYDVLDVKAA